MIKLLNTESGFEVRIKSLVFNGGEVNITILEDLTANEYSISAVIKSSQHVVYLLLLVDAVRRIKPNVKLTLLIPYVPYARQDRVCNKGEALSIKVFADLINSLHFDKVVTLDNHSDVSTALINNCVNLDVNKWFNPDYVMQLRNMPLERDLATRNATLVSPDAGSLKKIYSISKYYGGLEVIMATKHRDVVTGNILSTEVYCNDLKGKNVVIIDDICDGGRTFIELAKVLKSKNAGTIDLVITHGIFSQGLSVFEGLIDHIYTTNSFYEGLSTDYITVVDCFGVMNV